MNEQQLKGIFVPVITPFQPSGELDIPSFERYIDTMVNRGVDGIVVNGTTGESPTVTTAELPLLMEAALRARGSRLHIPIVLGTGTNDTASTVSRTKLAGELGADAALVVVPYYNRPSQNGIIEHYRRAADTGVPLIAYEIPQRTGVRSTAETILTILSLEGVIGLKDSSGGVALMTELARHTTKPVLSGEDESFLAMLGSGAQGGMMASASIRTESFIEVFTLFQSGKLTEAREAFGQLLPLVRLLFQEPNPAPIKWLMAEQGLIASDAVRLPLTGITAELQKLLAEWV
ncbi:4-hydroxy-tetrahydrodipicolinate synthase [Paenibacillus radicis (ex Gao et al. 2016)]|uniref:4-hydroxy-tetrahydrodipicolinate synthase n=1 Tax=Paenibacillus radicis (ex Gao et al. 2016) TaxID=1737354 RepID=A0A917HAS4_9BACL|nr:4-hydroxy-tetrahydrodipicolinate synthase [Paenibacillus radicis (ex Gao et al. 2016)]GGG73586.1 4-hydroxy-tetrahydrodipicolinate synthase 2 [Paenibacillus radicis (ex Gao et al. 2016)]